MSNKITKRITTDKQIDNNTFLSFSADFDTVRNEPQYTQINTYIWDSCTNDNTEENINIDNVNKLIHAVSIDWDNPSGCETLETLNNHNPIKTTDDLIFVLDRMAQIIINGSSTVNPIIMNNLTVLGNKIQNPNSTYYFKYVGRVNDTTDDNINRNISWTLSSNTNNKSLFKVYNDNNAINNLTSIINGSTVNVEFDFDKIDYNIRFPNNVIQDNNYNDGEHTYYTLTPNWSADFSNNISASKYTDWNMPLNINNDIDDVQLKASYDNAEDAYIQLKFSDFCPTSQTSQTTHQLSLSTKYIEVDYDNIDYSEYFETQFDNDNGKLVFKILQNIPYDYKDNEITITTHSWLCGQTSAKETTAELTITLQNLGLPIAQEEANIGIKISNNPFDNPLNNPENNLNFKIDTSLSSYDLINGKFTLDNFKESFDNTLISKPAYMIIIVPDDYAKITMQLGIFKTDFILSNYQSINNYKIVYIEGIELDCITQITFLKNNG